MLSAFKKVFLFYLNDFMYVKIRWKIESSHCECGECMDVFKTVDTIPFDKFGELEGIIVIELHFCPYCNEWKLDFIG